MSVPEGSISSGETVDARDVYYGDVGSVVNAGVFSGNIFAITAKARESVLAHSLDAASIRRLKAVYESVPAWERAVTLLRERHVVVLVGDPGSSRWITAVNLASRNGLIPYTVYLEPEDLRAQLPMQKSTGLLLNLSDLDPIALSPTTGEILLSHADRLGMHESALIVVATSREWRLLGLADRGVAVEMSRPPDPVRVFRKHLSYSASPDLADRCASRHEIVTALANAQPADAAELAGIAASSIGRAAQPDAWLADVVEAYRKWSSRIAEWFSAQDHQDGYVRAVLLASAALEGASISDIFAAANELAAVVELPRAAGAPLTGPGAAAIVAAVGAQEEGGRVRFTRPRYATSVLDHVWADRPHLRDNLQSWLIGLARRPTERAELSASALTGLAIRHREPSRITEAVTEWAKNTSLRPLAVEVLTLAAVDDDIGREIRRTMYQWSVRVTTDEGLALVVARVCGGDLGHAFPSVAMTRLRHLASHESNAVHGAVVAALVELAKDSRLRAVVLGEIASWFAADQPLSRQAAARRAFVAFTALRDDKDRFVMLVGAADSEAHQDALAEGWRMCLRDQGEAQAAQSVLHEWLDAVAHHGRLEPVAEILARSCKSSIDVGVLSILVWRWSRTADGLEATKRAAVGDRLLERIDQRDPLRNETHLAGATVGRGGNE